MTRTERYFSRCLFLLGLLIITACGLFESCTGHTSAQVDASVVMASTRTERPERAPIPRMDQRFRRAPEYVGLARVVWKEAGPRATAGEVAAIHQVISVKAQTAGIPYRSAAWGYSVGIRNPRNEAVHNLTAGTVFGPTTPSYISEGWYSYLRWAQYAHEGRLVHECREQLGGGAARLSEWGGPDVDRANIRRLVRSNRFAVADCPDTYHNAFLYEVQ